MKSLNKIIITTILAAPLTIGYVSNMRVDEINPSYYCIDTNDSSKRYCFWNFDGDKTEEVDAITLGDNPEKLLVYAPKMGVGIEEKIKKLFPDNEGSAIMDRSAIKDYIDQIVLHRDYSDK